MDQMTDALVRFGGTVFTMFKSYPILIGLALALVVAMWVAQARAPHDPSPGQRREG